jgi:hypothetical protein
MFLITKLRKINLFIVLLLVISINQPKLYAQKYSIDKHQKTKKARRPFSFRHLFKKDASKAAARQVKKDDKRMTKAMTNEQKANKKYQKQANKDKEKGQKWKVYSRMKKYEKQAERRRKNKADKNFFQRLFSSKKRRQK